MKQADVKVGEIYMVRVGPSHHLSKIRIDRIIGAQTYGAFRKRERWEGTNMATGRTITGTAARLRGPAPTYYIYASDLASCLIGPFNITKDAVDHIAFCKARGDGAEMKIVTSARADQMRPTIGYCITPEDDRKDRKELR